MIFLLPVWHHVAQSVLNWDTVGLIWGPWGIRFFTLRRRVKSGRLVVMFLVRWAPHLEHVWAPWRSFWRAIHILFATWLLFLLKATPALSLTRTLVMYSCFVHGMLLAAHATVDSFTCVGCPRVV